MKYTVLKKNSIISKILFKYLISRSEQKGFSIEKKKKKTKTFFPLKKKKNKNKKGKKTKKKKKKHKKQTLIKTKLIYL